MAGVGKEGDGACMEADTPGFVDRVPNVGLYPQSRRRHTRLFTIPSLVLRAACVNLRKGRGGGPASRSLRCVSCGARVRGSSEPAGAARGLKQQKRIFSRSWAWESKMEGPPGLVSGRSLFLARRRQLSALSSHGHCDHCACTETASSLTSLPLLKGTPVP